MATYWKIKSQLHTDGTQINIKMKEHPSLFTFKVKVTIDADQSK